MSDGTYAFLPWLRRGIATAIIRKDGEDPTGPRAQVDVNISLNNGSLTTSARIALLGAGEVTGVDPQAVIRTWPREGVYDAASSYFPLIEFDQADLPWRYTPAQPDQNGRLRPWLCLIALEDREYTRLHSADARHPLPAITITSAATSLPKVAQSWAWAHVQVSGVKTITGDQAAVFLASDPRRFLARLLCPRRLKPKTLYRAVVVPTFERGRLVGLGRSIPATTDALAEAWADDSTRVELPVYYDWEFQSGAESDFEDLVRQLNKEPPPSGAGTRDMDVSAPGVSRVAAATKPLGVEGALRVPKPKTEGGTAPDDSSTSWSGTERRSWVDSLAELVNAPHTLLTSPVAARHLAPPLYGRWHAGHAALVKPRPPRPWYWFVDVNSDPRLRVVAAVGAKIVRDQQEQLMASAWRQVEGIRAANAELRQAQLAREVAKRIYERHIAADDTEVVLQLTGPLHGRVREPVEAAAMVQAPLTVRARLKRSPVPAGVLAPQWRRIARPQGPVGRRQGRPVAPRLSTILERLNSGNLLLAPAPQTPDGMANLADLGIRPDVLPDDLRVAPRRAPAFQATEYPFGRPPEKPPDAVDANTDPDSRSVAPFRAAVAATWESLTSTPRPLTPTDRAPLGALKQGLIDDLKPDNTVAASYTTHVLDSTRLILRPRLRMPPDQNWHPEDPLEPVMAAPKFPQPMMEPLRQLSQDWIFPGLDKVPPNSMTVLEVNRRFIFAYMLGINHEMAGELLWNEYPTDQRGTYFSRFWDPACFLPQPGQTVAATALEDIDPIDQWPQRATLQKAGKETPLAANPLVLLIRGDLLARYPNLLLYAAEGKLKPTDFAHSVRDPTNPEDREPSFAHANERHPLFSGTLKPDVAYFAFNLSAEEALGRGTPGQTKPGWYFVLQEQPSEARFGLDATPSGTTPPTLKSWNDLAWGHLQGTVNYIDLDLNQPAAAPANNPEKATWAVTTPPPPLPPAPPPPPAPPYPAGRASDMAFITLQRQVRIAVHASEMIAT